MDTLRQDLRLALRFLRRHSGTTTIAIVTIALGIGATTAIFSVVNALMLRPLPYRDPDRLAVVWEQNRPRGNNTNVVSPANFIDWQEQNTVFDEMAAFVDLRANLTGLGDPEEIPVQLVTANMFRMLGTDSRLGRVFNETEANEGAPRAVVLSHRFWQSRLGGDPKVLERALELNGLSHTVIGVMPPDFELLVRQGSFTAVAPELWLPYRFTAEHRTRRGRFMLALARLKPGIPLSQARAEMDTIAGRLEQQYPEFNTGWGVNLVPLREQLIGDVRPALLVLLAAVGFVLLIACANVANLLLVRASGRQKEIAVRAALGAGRGRITRQLLTEGTLLSVAGGFFGIILAYFGVRALVVLCPAELQPLALQVNLDGRVLAITALLAFLTGLAFGLVPAIEGSRVRLAESLQEEGRGSSGSRRSSRMRNAFVAAQVMLSLVLLVAAGLMIRSFLLLQAVDPGFDPNRVMTFRVSLPNTRYPERSQTVRFFNRLAERLETLPGVRSAGGIVFLPFAGPGSATDFTVVGRPAPPPGQEMITDVRVVHPGYFATMSIPLIRGRLFNPREASEPANVVVINETLARQVFPGEDPIGKKLIIDMSDVKQPDEIIGVVADVRHASLSGEVRPMTYWPYPRYPFGFMTMTVRTSGEPSALAGVIRREVRALDKDQPAADVRTMNEIMATVIARPRFNMALLAVFALLATVLASVGIYGVMSYAAAQRTHEIGVRMALGGTGRQMSRLLIGQGMRTAAAGAAGGLAAAWWLTRYMAGMLYGVTATDAVTFLAVTAFLLGVALLGCYIPARRAARVYPADALRS